MLHHGAAVYNGLAEELFGLLAAQPEYQALPGWASVLANAPQTGLSVALMRLVQLREWPP